MLLIAVAAVLAATSPVDTADYAWKEGEYKVLENAQFKLYVRPQGASVMSIWSKAIGAELTNPSAAGSFTEFCWDRGKSRDFLLKQPFAMRYSTGDGDNFGLINAGNSENAIKKVLEWDSDVIVLGGFPFDALPAFLRMLLVERVKKGAGLVLLGPDRSIPELGLKVKGGYKRLAARRGGRRRHLADGVLGFGRCHELLGAVVEAGA